MSQQTKKHSDIHQRRMEFRDFVQNGKKSVADALAFARQIRFPMPEYYIAHAIFIRKWEVEKFSPTENGREQRKSKREQVHARTGAEIIKNYSESEIQIIDPWISPT